MNKKESGRKMSWPNSILTRILGKPQETSIRIAVLRVETWAWDLWKTRQDCQPLGTSSDTYTVQQLFQTRSYLKDSDDGVFQYAELFFWSLSIV